MSDVNEFYKDGTHELYLHVTYRKGKDVKGTFFGRALLNHHLLTIGTVFTDEDIAPFVPVSEAKYMKARVSFAEACMIALGVNK